MNEVLQYGALGILGALVLFLVPFLVRWLVRFIECQKKELQEIRDEFFDLVGNHLNSQTKALAKLTDAIDRLCRMWGNGGV